MPGQPVTAEVGEIEELLKVITAASRFLIEMVLLGAAVIGAWIVWPVWAAIAVSILGAVMVVPGVPRYRWLARRAPPPA